MTNQDAYTKFFIAAATAEGYHRTAEMIRQQIRDGFEFMIKFSGPYVINLSFACELYIKALLLLNNIDIPKGRDGHNLKELFEILTEDDKLMICERFGDNPPVCNFLNSHPQIFVDYRYPYEDDKAKDNESISLKELESFSSILGAVCQKHQEESNHAD